MSFIKSNSIGLLALFVALGGTAAAISSNSIKSQHIAKDAVKARQLAPNAVRSGEIKDRSVKPRDLSAAILSGEGAPGLKGPQGEPGTPGQNLEYEGVRVGGSLVRHVASPSGTPPTEIPLGSFGPLTVSATCAVLPGSVHVRAQMLVRVNSGGAASFVFSPIATVGDAKIWGRVETVGVNTQNLGQVANTVTVGDNVYDLRGFLSVQRSTAVNPIYTPPVGNACGISRVGIEKASG